MFGSATPRPESWAALERLELGGRLGGKLPPVRVVDLRRERGYPLSAPLLAELGKVAEQGGKAILLLNRRGLDPGDPLPHLRRHPPLSELRRRPGPPRLRRAALPSLRPRRAGTRALPRVWLGRARPARRRHAAARARARRRACPSWSSIRLDADTPRPVERRSSGSPRPTGRCCSARRWSRRATTSKGVALAAVVDADTGLAHAGLPGRGAHVPAADPARGPQRPRRAGPRDRSRRSSPTRGRSSSPPGTTSGGSWRASSSGARRSATRRSVTSCGSSSPGRRPTRRCARLQELKAALAATPICSARRRSCGCAAATARSSSPRPTAPARSRPRAAAALAAAAPAMRKAGLTAVVDVDPQSL